MTANERPMDVLWIEVPATSSAADLARVIDEFRLEPRGVTILSTWI